MTAGKQTLFTFLRLARRSLRWWRYTGRPPWRQKRISLELIDPRPLDKYALAGLAAMCHICSRPKHQPGEIWCSYPHPLSSAPDNWTLETWSIAYGEAMQWRDWQTCDQMLAERESESWWPAERERLNAIPDPPGAGWSE